MQRTSALLLTIIALAFTACDTKTAKMREIEAIEQRFTAQYTHERSDSLVNLYREVAKSVKDNPAFSIRCMTRAAEIQFTKRLDGVAAARWLNDAISNFGKGQDITEPLALYARIYNNYQYQSATTYKMDPKDITTMQNHLLDNKTVLDTALTRIDRKMAKGGEVMDKALALQFIDTAEGYAAITDSEDKYADLLSKAAGLAKTIDEYNKAILLYNRLCERLPRHAKARTALFMQGFIYENDLQNIEKAKATYLAFLKQYPNDTDYTDDIQMALKTLGKTPEEIIQGFQK